MGLFQRKAIFAEHEPHNRLKRTLSWWHLMALGVGAIVGTGIYTLIGVGAGLAGPAVMLSFIIAGIVCACAALCYAELSTSIPASGSTYTYSYAALGEIFAWVVGWSLILEYSLVVRAVAVGWSGYATGFLDTIGVHMPIALKAGPHAGGIVNLPAVGIIFLVAGLLCLGTKESTTLNAILVVVKILALILFICIALPHFDAGNFHPFMPYGFEKSVVGGHERGVLAAAAIIFFAFYGFDAISTAAEEAKNPKRDLAIGIIGAMVLCTAIYVAVAAVAVGAMPFLAYANSPEPLALILRELGQSRLALIIAAAAIVALPTVILAFLFGQSRIFFVMARDGLLPRFMSRVSAQGVPVRVTLITSVLVSILAGLFPLDEIAALANAGTLVAFVAAGLCVMILRFREPTLPRGFKVPVVWVLAPIAVLGCAYLFYNLPHMTQIYFAAWNGLGLAVYLLCRRKPQTSVSKTSEM
ncbi:amino acid permease [Asticcacaulis sp.]|uniref:amino acid permease n=1 Tax=Asticcacaulis sp. TaxID=1872648 RepID=UPI003F7C9695